MSRKHFGGGFKKPKKLIKLGFRKMNLQGLCTFIFRNCDRNTLDLFHEGILYASKQKTDWLRTEYHFNISVTFT